MRISDWSSDVCSSDLEMADEMALQAADYPQLVDETQAVRHESLDEAYSDQSMWFADVEARADEALERANLNAALPAGLRQPPEPQASILHPFFVNTMNLAVIRLALAVAAARFCSPNKTT